MIPSGDEEKKTIAENNPIKIECTIYVLYYLLIYPKNFKNPKRITHYILLKHRNHFVTSLCKSKSRTSKDFNCKILFK